MNQCWRKIGVEGDPSCPELSRYIHCRNCPVYERGGRALLEKPAPEDYVREWTALLANRKAVEQQRPLSALVFRLGVEWLALNTALFVEIAAPRPVRRIPHRSNDVLLGMVAMRGEICLCFALDQLLGIVVPASESSVGRRLAILKHEGSVWAFEMDAIHGVQHYAKSDVQPLPVTVAKSAPGFFRGLIRAGDRNVGLLEEDLVFHVLTRQVL